VKAMGWPSFFEAMVREMGHEFLSYMNSYIQSDVAGAIDTTHFTSCVSTADDYEDNMNAGPGDKTANKEEEAALDIAEENIQKKGRV
jgi:hypothetical protein